MITVLENSDNILKFRIKSKINEKLSTELHYSLCNSIRRIMLAEIKTPAIDIVGILKNNSILPDPMLAHRLGQIPIKLLGNVENVDDIVISLKISHDVERADIYGVHTIYTSDLEYDRELIEIEPNIIVIKLLKGHEIDLEARIREGTGMEHSKWSPVCVSSSVECEDEPGSFEFLIETVGTMKPVEVFTKAIDTMCEKMDNIM